VTGQEIYRGSMRGGLLHIKQLGFQPQTVIDVGAALGTFDLYEVFPESKHFLIEPIVENESYLAQICRKLGNAEYIIAAATRQPGTVNLNVHPALVHSSVSDSPSNIDESLSTREILGITLDQICRERQLEPPYLIKVDVDGNEIDVLDGATQILSDTEYVIVEVTLFSHMYEVIDFMKSKGFVVYDIVDLSWRPSDHALAQCDMAFVKETGQFKTNDSYIREDQREFYNEHLKAYRERLIAYIEKNYSDSDEGQTAISNKTLLTKDLRLRDINIIIFPDWSQSEDLLFQDLVNLLRVVATHPEKSNITLLVDISNISDKDAELVVSGVVMHLLMEEEIDVEEGPEISLFGNLSEMQWSVLFPHIHARIVLEQEDQQAIAQARTQELTSYPLDSFSSRQIDFFDLSNKLFLEGRWQEAIDQYQKILKTQTGDAELYWRLSECFRQLNLLDQAFSTLKDGIQLYPTDASLHFTLVVNLQGSGRIQEAISSANTAASLLPNDYTFKIIKNLLVPIVYETLDEISFYRQRFTRGLQTLIQQTSLETTEEQTEALLGISRLTNFYLSFQAQNDRELQRQYGNLVHKIMAANYPKWVAPLSMSPLKENNKIRVGYVSAYLHSYSGTLWLTGWLRYCEHKSFEIYCYYIGNEPDPVTQQFQNYSDVFHHIPHNLEAACEQIIADQLHILVFPEIGMNPQTMQMAALQLAPVQCVAWGHPVTSGLPTIDYFLSSDLMEPDKAQEHYSETLIRLPNIGVSYPKPYIPSITKTRTDFQLSDDGVIYLCCQAPYKYLPQYDFVFAEIARRVPQAQFVFLRGNLLKQRLDRAFTAVGLKSEDYCVFLTIPERLDYLTINLLSDVYLDTFTWSGGNTTLEAIACNLPIVTCPGEFMRGRHSYSFLRMIGVTETIAQNEMEYIEIAVKLGIDPAWRRNIVERMSESHDRVFDDKACVTGLEAFYKQVFWDYRLAQ
jgi:FkbM family methyltransferase